MLSESFADRRRSTLFCNTGPFFLHLRTRPSTTQLLKSPLGSTTSAATPRPRAPSMLLRLPGPRTLGSNGTPYQQQTCFTRTLASFGRRLLDPSPRLGLVSPGFPPSGVGSRNVSEKRPSSSREIPSTTRNAESFKRIGKPWPTPQRTSPTHTGTCCTTKL